LVPRNAGMVEEATITLKPVDRKTFTFTNKPSLQIRRIGHAAATQSMESEWLRQGARKCLPGTTTTLMRARSLFLARSVSTPSFAAPSGST
jgi:hypothetical protein